VVYDRETFSRLLVRVAWSDTKLFSQLAFLCNMAYVIPAIKVYFPSFTWVFLYFLVNFLDLIPLICRPRI